MKEARNRRYPAKFITETEDLAASTNIPAQAESLLHSLEQAAGRIVLYVNVIKTEFICYRQKEVVQFTYLGSNISFTESNLNVRLVKAWNAIDKVSIKWKSNLSDIIKRDFFYITLWMLHIDTNKMHGGKHWWEQDKNAVYCPEQILEAAFLLWKPYPSYHNGLFSPLFVLEISLSEGRSRLVLSEQYETSYLFYVTLSFLCYIICYLISVFVYSLVTPSGATTIP